MVCRGQDAELNISAGGYGVEQTKESLISGYKE